MTGTDLVGQRVLVVEDEILVSMLLEDMLNDLACKVVGPAATIDEALYLVGSTKIDCAILDISVKGSEIYPVADALAEMGVPFIFATGHDAGEVRQSYGRISVLRKPFEPEDLKRVLSDVLLVANSVHRDI